jgi:hypothetical protein
MGAGNNNGIVQAGDGGIIFDGGTFDTGAFVIAPWANATSGIRIVGSTGNVGIGTSSPGTRLTVAAAGESGARFLGNGLTSAGLFVGYNSAAYVYNDSNTPLIFGTNAAERMRITEAGRVLVGLTSGISVAGATAGIQTAAVAGFIDAMRFSADSAGPLFKLVKSRSATVGTNAAVLSGDAIGQIGFIGADGTSYIFGAAITGEVDGTPGTNDMPGRLVFSTTPDGSNTPAERMRITSGGNVGIGTSSPTDRLQVNAQDGVRLGSSGNVSYVRIGSAFTGEGTAQISYDRASGAIAFSQGSTGSAPNERMRIDASGNVGIGTTAPSAPLDVNGNVAITGTARRITGDFSNATIANRVAFQTSTANASTSFSVIPNGTNTQSDFFAFNSSDPNNASVMVLRVGTTEASVRSGALGTGTLLPMTFHTGASERMRITSDGEVYIAGTTDQGAFNLQVNGTGVWGAGAYTNGSDARIKDDISPIASGLDVVAKLRPVQFRYKESWSKDRFLQPGFIAQELQEALADQPYVEGVVHQGPEYMSVSYQTLIPVLTKAVQELTAKLEAAEARIANLENR